MTSDRMLRAFTLLALVALVTVATGIAASGLHSSVSSSMTTQSIWDSIVGFFSNLFNAITGNTHTSTIATTSVKSVANITKAPAYSIQLVSVSTVSYSNASTNVTSVGSNILFQVTLQNTGTEPVYFGRGCSQALVFTVSPSNAISTRPNGAGTCAAQTSLSVLSPNATVTIDVPYFAIATIAGPGNATVDFTFYYSKNVSVSSDRAYNATFSADFDFHLPPTVSTTSASTSTLSTASTASTTSVCNAYGGCGAISTTTMCPGHASPPVGCSYVVTNSSPCGNLVCTTATTTALPAYSVQVISTKTISYFNGTPNVTTVGSNILFQVALKNSGTAPIYFGRGCSQALVFTVSPSNAISTRPNGAGQCAQQTALSEMAPGTNLTLTMPSYAILTVANPGTATVHFTFYWSKSNVTSSYQSNNMTFSQNFNFH